MPKKLMKIIPFIPSAFYEGGLQYLADRIKKNFNFDCVFSNKLKSRKGVLTGQRERLLRRSYGIILVSEQNNKNNESKVYIRTYGCQMEASLLYYN